MHAVIKAALAAIKEDLREHGFAAACLSRQRSHPVFPRNIARRFFHFCRVNLV